MKRFLDKTWAKAAAFVLTLVFGVLTVLGGVGVAYRLSAMTCFWTAATSCPPDDCTRDSCVQLHLQRRQLPARHAGQRGRAGQMTAPMTTVPAESGPTDVTEEVAGSGDQRPAPALLPRNSPATAAACHLTVTASEDNGEVVYL